jgi:outer membrane protein, multidrug efflux system
MLSNLALQRPLIKNFPFSSIMNCPYHFLKILGPVLAVLLTACTTVGPSYQPPNPVMPPHWTEAAPDIPVQANGKIGTWWTLFKDPLLDSLVIKAIAENQDLGIAETRIREARAQRRMTAASGLPAVGTSGAYTHSRTGENTSSGKANQDLFQAGFDVGWEIDLFGGIRRATEAADATVAASVEDKRDVLVSLVAEVARNYLELQGSRQRLAITKENIDIQQKTVDMVKKRFQIGFGSELAVVQAETQLAMTMSQVPGLEAAAAQSMHQLALLLGHAPDALVSELTASEIAPLTPPQVPITLPSDLLRQRPDIRRAERQLAAATAEIGVATAELFPSFSLSALVGLESTSFSNLVTSGSRFWSLGPKVQWSLFDGGKARAGIEVSNSRKDRAHIGYEKTVLTALVEVENALVAISREQETHRILAIATSSAQRALTISKSQYELGLVDFLNVLQSEFAFYQSQDQLVQSEQRLSLDTVSLFKALGGGWDLSVYGT